MREQYDNLKDGKTQKTVDDNVRMLKNMTDSEVRIFGKIDTVEYVR